MVTVTNFGKNSIVDAEKIKQFSTWCWTKQGRMFMKKTFLVAAVLIAAIFVSCEVTAPDVIEAAAAAGNSARTVSFNVVEVADGTVTLEYAPPVVKSTRALSLPLAKAATDLYEVVFADEDEGDLWRRNFKEGQTIRMTVTLGDYGIAGDYQAYMFAGRKVDGVNVLLAVGTISDVEYKDGTHDTTGPDFSITANTYKVTFELEALETDITLGEDSTFKSWDAANTVASGFPAANEDFVAGASVKYASICNPPVPVFTIPEDKATTGSIEIKTSYDANAIKLDTAASVPIKFTSAGFFVQGSDAPMADVTVSTSATAFASIIPITMTPAGVNPVDTDLQKSGLAVFTYDIAVFNYDDATPTEGVAAMEWVVRGGITNPLYDQGPALDSQGGKIILGVGDLSGIDFITDTPDGDDDEGEGFIVTPGDIS